MNTVELSQWGLFHAALAGCSRHVKSIFNKEGANGADNRAKGWQYNCDGAVGEAAFAKWCGVFWDGSPGVFRSRPDAGGYEVRTIVKAGRGLILRDADKEDDSVYVLVDASEMPSFKMIGWITGEEGKRIGEWRKLDPNRPECFVVEPNKLHPMETLPWRKTLAS